MTDKIEPPKSNEDENEAAQFSSHEKNQEEFESESSSENAELSEQTPENSESSPSLTSSASIKKIIALVVSILVLIIIGYYIKHSYSITQLRKQVATQIVTQSMSMQDMMQYVGQGITAGKNIKGSVDQSGQNAQLVFDVKGSKGTAVLTAVYSNGQLKALSLRSSNGQTFDVLKDQAAYETEQAAKAALAAKQAAIEATYHNAVQALKNKNYPAAITEFTQSIQNDYQKTQSYQYLGFAYSQNNQYVQCVSAYQAYLQQKSDDSEAYYQLAYCYLQMYETTDALTNLDKSCQLSYQAACDAATAIRAQLNQKPTDNGYAPLSPQQSIKQQNELQKQLQPSSNQEQEILNNTETGESAPSSSSVPTSSSMTQ